MDAMSSGQVIWWHEGRARAYWSRQINLRAIACPDKMKERFKLMVAKGA